MKYSLLFIEKKIVHLLVLVVFATSCANPVSPTGGPKDETPPEIIKTSPSNLSTNFTGNEITLYFDEFISLKDINSQLIISPPLKETPEFRVRGKSLIAQFKEAWRSETTYNIFFGDAIVDITEGNSLSGYKFTFSTGDILDSMIVKGKLINAFNLTPVKGAYVMLYDSIYDSVPYKQIPYYISRTNESGEFELTNLRDMQYQIFALTDLNANYLFDLSNEEISFVDTLISPWFEQQKEDKPIMLNSRIDSLNNNDRRDFDTLPDSTLVDSVVIAIVENDSIAIIDTIVHAPIQDSTALRTDSVFLATLGGKELQLFHFKEVDSVQRLLKAQLLRENVISFQFKVSVKQPQFDLLEANEIKPLIGNNTGKDTLTMWLPGFNSDSIKVKVSDGWNTLDTIEMSVKVKEKSIKKNDSNKKPSLKVSTNIVGGRIKPGSSLRISFVDPVGSYNLSRVFLKEDSVFIENPSIKFIDSIQRHLEIKYPWKVGIHYSVTLSDSSIVGIMGTSNDSTTYSFMTLTEEETAKLSLAIDLPENTPYIIQLLDTKEKILQQYFITEDMTLAIPYLAPGKYKIKAIDDRNGNGYWDTGKYLIGRYPERVIYFSKELELRANWTLDETWKIPESGK